MPQSNVIATTAMLSVVTSAIIAGSVFAPGDSDSSNVASSAGDNTNSVPAGTNMTGMTMTISNSY
ncbi:MAG: hypothetical protein M3Z01_09315 [Thermoproteota archaeon]|nr:hypothetical protein [Thermoproteota archaeon]